MQRRQFNKALAAAAASSAIAPFNMARAQAQKLRVGVILPRSGYLGFIGQSCQKGADLAPGVIKELLRSEEHTSELQSQSNLVCRLLLEKKKEMRWLEVGRDHLQ